MVSRVSGYYVADGLMVLTAEGWRNGRAMEPVTFASLIAAQDAVKIWDDTIKGCDIVPVIHVVRSNRP